MLLNAITAIRKLLYDSKILKSYRSKLKVISVGNIALGGSGKTPLLIYIAQELIRAGKTPCVLSRGYKGSLQGPILVAVDHKVEEVGDEPKIYCRNRIPVVIAKDRVAGARYIEEQGNFDVILVDDGFQHFALQRDLDILAVDASSAAAINSFIKAKSLPFDLFREKTLPALHRANIVVFATRAVLPDHMAKEFVMPAIQLLHPKQRYFIANGAKFHFSVPITTKTINILTTIANPQPFVASLRRQGLVIKQCHNLRDHAVISPGLINQLLADADSNLVVTEKDYVKISELPIRDSNLVCATMELSISDGMLLIKEILQEII